MKKFLLAVLSYVVLTMLWGFPWHVLWFHDLHLEIGAFTRDPPIMSFGIAAILIQGSVIAYLYPFCYRDGHPIVQGIKFSLIAGLMLYSEVCFATVAKFSDRAGFDLHPRSHNFPVGSVHPHRSRPRIDLWTKTSGN